MYVTAKRKATSAIAGSVACTSQIEMRMGSLVPTELPAADTAMARFATSVTTGIAMPGCSASTLTARRRRRRRAACGGMCDLLDSGTAPVPPLRHPADCKGAGSSDVMLPSMLGDLTCFTPWLGAAPPTGAYPYRDIAMNASSTSITVCSRSLYTHRIGSAEEGFQPFLSVQKVCFKREAGPQMAPETTFRDAGPIKDPQRCWAHRLA